MIIGITATFSALPKSPDHFNSWYCSTFSCFFSFIKYWTCYINMWYPPVSMSTVMMSDLLCSSLWSVCTEKSSSILALSFSSTLFCVCSYYFTLYSSWKSIPFVHCPRNNLTNSVIMPYVAPGAFFIQQANCWLCPVFLPTIHIGGETVRWSMVLCMLIAVSAWSCAVINIPLFPSSTILSSASSKLLGSSLHLFTS